MIHDSSWRRLVVDDALPSRKLVMAMALKGVPARSAARSAFLVVGGRLFGSRGSGVAVVMVGAWV